MRCTIGLESLMVADREIRLIRRSEKSLVSRDVLKGDTIILDSFSV